ncbi:hypothetical protein J2858_000617 [Neorhizobium galegae]|nr:hypothetical protein [Neorhizobium galegae]MBP2547724.1 hypothetical protein [Neorhizobium galegae]
MPVPMPRRLPSLPHASRLLQHSALARLAVVAVVIGGLWLAISWAVVLP